jgi:ankyrin repeat protein
MLRLILTLLSALPSLAADPPLIDAILLAKTPEDGATQVRKLLEKGANANATDEKKQPAIFWAIFKKNTSAVKLLLDHGANIEARDREQVMTPLMQAAYDATFDEKSQPILELLIERGAKVNAETKFHDTALMYVVSNSANHPNALKVSELLLEHGADPNAAVVFTPGKPGITVLMNAAREGATDIARLLVKKGARKGDKGPGFHTAAHFAHEAKHDALAKELEP